MPRTKRQPVEPEFRRTYSFPVVVNGVRVDDYWRVSGVHPHGRGQWVDLRRHATGEGRRMALRKFQRRARPSPR